MTALGLLMATVLLGALRYRSRQYNLRITALEAERDRERAAHQLSLDVAERAAASLRESERLQQEAVNAMRASEERFRGLIQHSRDIFLLVSAEGRIHYASPSFTRLLGYAEAAVSGMDIRDAFSRDDSGMAASLDAVLRSPGATADLEVRIRRQDGSWLWMELTAANHLEESAIGAVVINLRDIGERKEIEEQKRTLNELLESQVETRTRELKAAVSELEAFSYSVSHDLRSPLRHIGGFVELLQAKSAASLDDQGRRYLDIIAQSVERMDGLISHLLAFSKMSRQALRMRTFDMAEVVRQCIAELEPETRGRTVEWLVGELPPAYGDADLIRQVMGNLLANALKFTRTRGLARIEVASQATGGEIAYLVRDNGVGFDMHYRDKLFGVFQRLHSGTEFEGTGIGLATVQRIVHRHGGKVWAEGRPDEGACFYLSLPEEGRKG